jgi:paraquat-inducible protein B
VIEPDDPMPPGPDGPPAQPLAPAEPPAASGAAEPLVRRGRPSLVWLIPAVAALIGSWMAIKALAGRGPTITITFHSAEGLEPGQTRIRHKGVEIGKLSAVALGPDFKDVVVTAEMANGTGALLTAGTRFWVVRAQIGSRGISGLGTIVSGAFIDMAPGPAGPETHAFRGLEAAPILPPQAPGEMVTLRAERLGSLNIGSPVTYRQIRVGEVAGFDLDPDGRQVLIQIQVHAPYNDLVRQDTRFWDAGGVDVNMDAGGLHLHTDSLVQLLMGGIALDNPDRPGPPAAPGQVFTLHPDSQKAHEPAYQERHLFVLNFAESVRGLAAGAPVEFRGVRVGQVESYRLEFDARALQPRIPVLIALEPERFHLVGGPAEAPVEQLVARMVRKGLRAQLKAPSLISGGQIVDLDFHPGAPPRTLAWTDGRPEIPTLPSSLGALLDNLSRFAARLQALPLEDLAGQVQSTLPRLRETLDDAGVLMRHLDRETLPQAQATLAQAREAFATLERTLRADSPAQEDLRRALGDFAQAARSLRDLADSLERHPEVLLRGKGDTP